MTKPICEWCEATQGLRDINYHHDGYPFAVDPFLVCKDDLARYARSQIDLPNLGPIIDT